MPQPGCCRSGTGSDIRAFLCHRFFCYRTRLAVCAELIRKDAAESGTWGKQWKVSEIKENAEGSSEVSGLDRLLRLQKALWVQRALSLHRGVRSSGGRSGSIPILGSLPDCGHSTACLRLDLGDCISMNLRLFRASFRFCVRLGQSLWSRRRQSPELSKSRTCPM